MDYRAPGSFVYGILQAKILEWVAISFSKGKIFRGKIVALNNVLKLEILFNKHSKVVIRINVANSKKKAGNNDHKRTNSINFEEVE